MQTETQPIKTGTGRHAKHARIRARIVQMDAEAISSWTHLTVEQRIEAERLMAAADVSGLMVFMDAHGPYALR